MTKIALTFLLLFMMAAAVLAPAAAAEQLHSNVVAWTPKDVQPAEPVAVVLQLYTAGASPYPNDGKPVAAVNDIEVLIRGEGQTRRFATEEIGGGRYRTEIVFPTNGGWDIRVRYGPGSYGPGDEIQLGKGGICVGAEICDGEQPAQDVRAQADGRPSTTIAVALGLVTIIALVTTALIWFGGLGRRRRLAGHVRVARDA